MCISVLLLLPGWLLNPTSGSSAHRCCGTAVISGKIRIAVELLDFNSCEWMIRNATCMNSRGLRWMGGISGASDPARESWQCAVLLPSLFWVMDILFLFTIRTRWEAITRCAVIRVSVSGKPIGPTFRLSTVLNSGNGWNSRLFTIPERYSRGSQNLTTRIWRRITDSESDLKQQMAFCFEWIRERAMKDMFFISTWDRRFNSKER